MLTVPLTMLLWSSLLMFILILIPAGIAIHRNGPTAQAGARDDLPEPSAFMKRANRLNANMRENMILFIALVVIVEISGIRNPNIEMGAMIFFYARLVHAPVYLLGLPAIRPILWGISLVGMGMMASPLFA